MYDGGKFERGVKVYDEDKYELIIKSRAADSNFPHLFTIVSISNNRYIYLEKNALCHRSSHMLHMLNLIIIIIIIVSMTFHRLSFFHF